jgi:hypothetical protein
MESHMRKCLLKPTGLTSVDFFAGGGFGYNPIDSNRVLAIEVDDNGIGLLTLENVNPTN